jgi:predicted MFS family arabinose efflux permease
MIQGPAGGFGPLDWAAIVLAATSGVVLVVHERRQPHPMVPIDLFTIRPFVAANIVTLLVYGGMGVVFFLLSIQLQVALGWSPLAAGAALLPVTGLMMVLSSRAGDLAQRIGPRWPLTFGPLLIAGGMLLLSGLSPGDVYVSGVLPGVLVFGLGLAASVAPVTATALGSIPDERAGAASGLNNAVSRSGQLLTIAAVPPLVGLTGDALGDPGELASGFDDAMRIGAGFVVAGALAAALMFRADDAIDDPDTPDDDAAADHDDCSVRYHCGVESPQLVRR